MTPREQAIEALEAAKNGLEWYWDLFPTTLTHDDGEMAEQIDAALAALRGQAAPPPSADRALLLERERCARICEAFAQMMLDGAGDGFPGGRLWQAARDIRAGEPVPGWYDPSRKEPTDEEAFAKLAAIRARLGQGEKT